MSTHNIDFYEDLTKIIFELSSNIIKYAPYAVFGDNIDPVQNEGTNAFRFFIYKQFFVSPKFIIRSFI